jgi:AcrR family transcriptional regulator
VSAAEALIVMRLPMGKRAAAAEETRRRIVDATHALHIEQGVAATSWDDIAGRAGVGVGTVYRPSPRSTS